jgi:hypothetical protein
LDVAKELVGFGFVGEVLFGFVLVGLDNHSCV